MLASASSPLSRSRRLSPSAKSFYKGMRRILEEAVIADFHDARMRRLDGGVAGHPFFNRSACFAAALDEARRKNRRGRCDMQDEDAWGPTFGVRNRPPRHIGDHRSSCRQVGANADRNAIGKSVRAPGEGEAALPFEIIEFTRSERIVIFSGLLRRTRHHATSEDVIGRSLELLSSSCDQRVFSCAGRSHHKGEKTGRPNAGARQARRRDAHV